MLVLINFYLCELVWTLEGILVNLSGWVKWKEDCESLEKARVLNLLLNWDVK